MKLRIYLRRLVWFLAGIVALYLLVVLVENWTGAHALAAAKLKLEQAGETLDLDSLRAKTVPDDLNFCAIDLLAGITLDDEEHGKTKNAEFKKLDWSRLWADHHTERPSPVFNGGCRLGIPFDLQQALAHLRDVTYLDSPAEASAAEVLSDIDRLHPLLKELGDSAPARPKAAFVPVFGLGYKGGPSGMPGPHLGSVQAIVRGLALRSQVAVEAGDSEGAVRSIQASLRLTQALGREPTLLDLFVAMTTSTYELNSIWSLIHGRAATEPQLARLESDLERRDFMHHTLQALRGELAFMIANVEWMKQHVLEREDILVFKDDVLGKHEPSWLVKQLARHIPVGWFDHNAVNIMRLHSTYVLEPFKTLDAARIVSGLNELDRVLSDHQSLLSPHYTLAVIVLPLFLKVSEQVLYCEAVRRQAVIAIAVERFRLTHSRLPETLAELVPAFLNAIPLDPMDGNSMRYKAEGNSFTLWSIAWDRRDNHGKLPTAREARHIDRAGSYIGDWVWKN